MKWLLPKRNRLRSHLGAGNEVPYIKFDESSGQVYSETTATIPTSDDRNWVRDSRIVKGANYLDEEEYGGYMRRLGSGRENLERHQNRLDELKNSSIRGVKGSRSLQLAAIECILENISDVTLDGIECLPTSIVRRIWHAVITRCSMSFYVWSIFSKILRQNTELLGLLKYHEEIEYPKCSLETYTDPLTSGAYDFLTSLSITAAFPIPDLLKLSAVKNLGTLEIINTQGSEYFAVGDRLLRSWQHAAVEKGAFPVLRILRLWKHESLTQKSLAYLDGFPALALYDVRGCSFAAGSKIEATLVGWKAILETDIPGLLGESCAKRALRMREKLGVDVKTCLKFSSERLWDGAKVRRIPRAGVPLFLAERAVSTDAVDSETKGNAGNKEKKPQNAELPTSKPSQSHSAEVQNITWDLASYQCFARIGELRNDTDLVRAGVIVGDQALVGDELINSIPMVSLRLGESPSWLESSSLRDRASNNKWDWADKPRLARSSRRGLAFIRIKVPPKVFVSKGGDFDSSTGLRDPAGLETRSTKLPPVRCEASGVVPNKKRKIEDVLSSFL